MLRRLLLVLLPLLVLLAGALGVPLAIAVAQRETQSTYLDRLADAGRFASLAENALASGRTAALRDELARYDELYGIPAALVAPGGRVLLSSRDRIDLSTSDVVAGLDAAFAGYRPDAPRVRWPWRDDPLAVVEPVGRDSEVVAAVVTVSPTDGLRGQVWREWGLLALVGLVPVLAMVAAAWPVSWWVLRPVRRLDEATAEVAGGRLDARADVHGPPELRRLARSFNTMVEVVGRALRRQRAFVSDASHQLRNPLASLRLAVDNLEPHLTGEAAREAHRLAVEETAEMGRVLDALLAATRLDSAAAAEPVELDVLVATHEPGWRAQAERAGMALVTDVPAGLTALAPPGGLGSVLDELVGNAVRLSGGSRVEVRADVRDDGVDLRVVDDGAGLDEEERAAATRRFWRSPRHQNVPGTGLGLAIVADLVVAAGGELDVRPASPRGLEVVVRLRR
ncbi:Signal transduction histidine kinase [Streptoalloteichus tenebrarius]|uniref:Signal transduction histidine-protein kinase/phosphatase MprB n=1 Tax=Streptoalloteichus tenebrarius (strain ATCC 17920 / DSM 40477 / JCM 4838 / CBS 697.72 / NBRC 16177 / NCIMB 11028 / NRRL B-12390 / A12253. 1 / ISP 5477) TaxID=1933 RepID=A0ABT1HNE4_STRSD|nr:HAMP domain-containing sensor histidine kinase [Streptoalloteichus tenebrarius]MCP2257032.1 Signal transduction histidine kinase [Streptoalloteichus tenebrarius]BFF00058.1 HAMP domain-containing sensor histidine kinase [Streptoalloteichus tenebrarius]